MVLPVVHSPSYLLTLHCLKKSFCLKSCFVSYRRVRSLMLFLITCLVFLLLSIERKYDPVRANTLELAAKRKRLSQIEQRTQAADINEG